MNEELNMVPVDEQPPDLDNGNGHTRRVPEWGDVEFVPTRRRRLLERIMSSRPVRNIAEYVEAEKRPMPGWATGLIIALVMATLTNGGILIYWKGNTDRFISTNETTHDDVVTMKLEIKQLQKDYEASQEQLGVMILYESKLRELIVSSGRFDPKDLPTMPTWPKRHGRQTPNADH